MAADRTQNITINYKFNTSEIAAAEATLKRANDSSNRLQQAGQKAGSAINQSFSQGTKSIGAMQIELQRLKSRIEVSTNPATTAKLSAEFKKLRTELEAATKAAYGLANAKKTVGSGAQSLISQFGQLYSAAQAVFGAAIIRQVVTLTLDMAKLAGNVDGVERAFKRAFPNSVAVLESLKKATRGTVSDFELMQRTLQATNLGVAVEQLPVLLEFAAARAQQTGESVDYLVDSIVRGIGRKSPLILDNLGLSAIRLKEKFDGVALASVSVADVTKGVAEIAREELDKMGGYAVNSTTKVNQLTVAWELLRVSLAKRTELGTGALTDFLTQSATGLRNLITGNKELFLEQARRVAAADALRVVESKEYKEFGQNQQGKFDFLQQEINTRVQIIGRYNDNIAKLKEERQLIDDNNPFDKRIDVLTKQIRAYNDNKVVIASTILALKEYLKAIDLVNKVEDPKTGIIERKKKEIEDLQNQIEKTNNKLDLGGTRLSKTGEVIQGRLIAKLEIAQAELADLQRAFIDFKVIEFENNINNAAQALSNIDEVLKGVGGQLSVTDPFESLNKKPPAVYTPDNWQKLKDDFVENWRSITSSAIDIQADQLKSMAESELMEMEVRLSNLQKFYDGQQLLAGDNEKAKEQLRIREERETNALRNEMARKEKQVRRSQVLIDVAAGIAKAFATYPWPYALIPAAFVAAQGASQLAMINRQPTNFAKGVIDLKGPGTETSDSIPANLSKGESVMTAWETRHAGDVLKEIRAKKIDNNKLRELKQGRAAVQSPTFNGEGIIKAIKDQKHPDVLKIANIAYEVRESTSDYKKRVRSSSMGI